MIYHNLYQETAAVILLPLPPGRDINAYLQNAVLNRARQVKFRTPACSRTKTRNVCTRYGRVYVLTSLSERREMEYR